MSRHTLACALLLVPLAAQAQAPPRFVKVEEKDGELTVPMTVTKTQLVPETITSRATGGTAGTDH